MIRIVCVVEAIIHDTDGKVLLLKRSDKNTHYLGKWQLPGGTVEDEETLEEAIQREVFEETGCYCSELELKKEVCFLSDSRGEEEKICLTVFYCKVDGDLSLSEDHKKHDFFEKHEIEKESLTPASKKALFE